MSALEKAAIEQALNAGEQFGYGNVMAWLATEWAVNLRDKWNMRPLVEPVEASDAEPLPNGKLCNSPEAARPPGEEGSESR